MKSEAALVFKIATEEWEFEQIHRLNYQTFVEEIPQHEPNRDGILIDKFHHENTYMICLQGKKLLGMVCVRDQRPFSLDQKLDNLDAYLPQGRSICEVRLLAVRKGYRDGRILVGLVERLAEYCGEHGYDLAIISGTVRQLKLYKHLGFTPFGPLVGTPDAPYQPMYLTVETFQKFKNGSRVFPQ